MLEPGFTATMGAAATNAEPDDPATQALGMARFTITDSGGSTQIFEIASPTINLGRENSSHVVLRHPSVSRRHGRIIVLPSDITLLNDLGSTNGTLVNNVRAREHRLKDQGRITIGLYELKYESTYGAKKSDWVEGIARYREAIRQNPNNFIAHAHLGWVPGRKGDIEDSIAECREALRLGPKDDFAHANLGGDLAHKGDWDAAVAEYREALLLNPRIVGAHPYLASALGIKGAWERESAKQREAFRRSPGYGTLHFNLGWVLVHKGVWDKKIAGLREALRLNPYKGEAHYLLGMVLEKKGNYEQALRGYRAAQKLDPQNPEYRKNCERLSWALPPEGTPPS